MGFLGADVSQLRGFAEDCAARSDRLTRLLAVLGSSVEGVEWTGPDAEAFRERWRSTLREGIGTGERLARAARDARRHAEEQDAASSADGPGAVIGTGPDHPLLTGLLRGRGLPGWVGGLTSAMIGEAPDPGDGSLNGLNGLNGLSGLSLAQAGHVAMPWTDGGGETPSREHEDVEGRLEDPSETSSSSASASASGPGAAAEYSRTDSADGSWSETTMISGSDTLFAGPLGKSEMRRSTEVGVAHDPGAGTVTFTFGVGAEQSLSAGGKDPMPTSGAPTSLDLTAATAQGTAYSVTMPEGSTMQDALAVDPSDPSSLPKGTSLTTTRSFGAEFSGSASVGIGSSPVAVGGDASVSRTDTDLVQVSRQEDGAYRYTSGAMSEESGSMGRSLSVPSVAKLRAGQTASTETSTLQTTAFEDSDAGSSALREAYAGGGHPDAASAGVADSWTDTHTVSTDGDYVSAQLGTTEHHVDASVSGSRVGYEAVSRTYADGHEQSIERAYPGLDESVVERRTQTGEAPTYVFETNHDSRNAGLGSDPHERSYYDEMWSPYENRSATEAQTDRVIFTEDEVERMRSHENTTDGSTGELGYLWNRAHEDPNTAAKTMYRDFNGLGGAGAVPQDVAPSDATVPGQSVHPAQTVEEAR